MRAIPRREAAREVGNSGLRPPSVSGETLRQVKLYEQPNGDSHGQHCPVYPNRPPHGEVDGAQPALKLASGCERNGHHNFGTCTPLHTIRQRPGGRMLRRYTCPRVVYTQFFDPAPEPDHNPLFK